MIWRRSVIVALLLYSGPWSAFAEPHVRFLTVQQSKGSLGRTDDPHQQRPQNNNNNFYFYANGSRVSNGSGGSTSTKATSSFYDDRKFTVYYYTTNLSDLYWCLLVVLGWTIWMMHSIHSLRQSAKSSSGEGANVTSPTPQTPEEYFPIFRQRYASLLHVRGHVLDVIPNPELRAAERTDSPLSAMSPPTHTLVVDYVVERQPQTTTAETEILQIRKYFATSAPAQVGFANIDVLVLPDDPMCALLLYDYESYLREEEGIQRVILQEQSRRRHRRQWRTPSGTGAKLDPIATMPATKADPIALLPNSPLRVVTAMEHEADVVLDDEDDDWFGFEVCRDWFDCSTIDAQQWKQMSLFFATLLVVASGIGCVQVVRRMDPHQRFLGWISLILSFLVMVPAAIWIHRVLLLCQRWSSEQSMEKQGFIVQSSTMTGTITSRDDATSLAEACRLPTCTEAMEDFCDRPGAAKYAPSSTISYVVPELSGCYFIRYPTATKNEKSPAPVERRTLDASAPSPAALVTKPSSSTSSISSISEGDHAVEGVWTMADRSV